MCFVEHFNKILFWDVFFPPKKYKIVFRDVC